MIEHVDEPGADEGADRRPGEDGVHVLVRDAAPAGVDEQEPCAEEEPDGRENAVGRDRDGPELDPDERLVGDGGEHGCERYDTLSYWW